MSPTSQQYDDEKVWQIDSGRHGSLIDFVWRILSRKAWWWCPGCQAFHAYGKNKSMECPFGNEVDKVKRPNG